MSCAEFLDVSPAIWFFFFLRFSSCFCSFVLGLPIQADRFHLFLENWRINRCHPLFSNPGAQMHSHLSYLCVSFSSPPQGQTNSTFSELGLILRVPFHFRVGPDLTYFSLLFQGRGYMSSFSCVLGDCLTIFVFRFAMRPPSWGPCLC